jgi:CheY-like chemotaxis protein
MGIDMPEPEHRRVLVVEDDEDLAASIAERLQQAGYPADIASNGNEALEQLSRDPLPGLILLDLLLPKMDGFTFLRHQRSDPRLSRVPVCVMSALVRAGDERIGKVSDAITKPIETDLLLQVVQRHCARR